MIEARAVTITRDGKNLLDSVSLLIGDGEITGIIGKSGSGKTLLLNALCGNLSATEGEILINSKPVRSYSRKDRVLELSFNDGSSPANTGETVADYLMLSRIIRKKPLYPFSEEDRQAVRNSLESFELVPYASTRLFELAGSTFRSVLNAYTVTSDARTIVFDEPLAGVDLRGRDLLQKTLARYTITGNRTAIISSHDINFITQTVDRIILLDGGKVVLDGTTDDISQELIRTYFGVEVLVSRNIYNGRPEIHVFPES
jgi:ABC-type cobalamin/Fe3+-siderophores transport system ATPase subunit